MNNVHAFLVLSLFHALRAQHLINNPVNIPTISIGRTAPYTCPPIQEIAAAQDELSQSISGILANITTVNFTC